MEAIDVLIQVGSLEFGLNYIDVLVLLSSWLISVYETINRFIDLLPSWLSSVYEVINSFIEVGSLEFGLYNIDQLFLLFSWLNSVYQAINSFIEVGSLEFALYNIDHPLVLLFSWVDSIVVAIFGFIELDLNLNKTDVLVFLLSFWVDSESLDVLLGLNFDISTVTMLISALIVSSLVHIYYIDSKDISIFDFCQSIAKCTLSLFSLAKDINNSIKSPWLIQNIVRDRIQTAMFSALRSTNYYKNLENIYNEKGHIPMLNELTSSIKDFIINNVLNILCLCIVCLCYAYSIDFVYFKFLLLMVTAILLLFFITSIYSSEHIKASHKKV